MVTKHTGRNWVPVMTFGFAILITMAGVVTSYARLESHFQESCKRFTQEISHIETYGSAVSVENRERIARLEERLKSIDTQLAEIKAGQKDILAAITK